MSGTFNLTQLNTSNIDINGETTIGGHIIPSANDTFDIGSAEKKIRDLYVSDNSIWIGDETKISFSDGKMKFRKRKKDVVPAAIIAAGSQAGHVDSDATKNAALAYAGVGSVSDMKIHHWHNYMRTLQAAALMTDIFRDNREDYEETSASDAWKEINDTKIYTDANVGVGTSDPESTLHIRGSIKVEDGFSLARNEGNNPSVIIDTQNFGLDTSVVDLTGMGSDKYTKLYRVYGTNSQGVGKNWYWGYANDDYTNFSLSFDGSGGNDPDIAFVFTTSSELYCNEVYSALKGNADTATRLQTPRTINGVAFDGSADITIPAGVDGITSSNGNIGIGTSNPTVMLHNRGETMCGTGGDNWETNKKTMYFIRGVTRNSSGTGDRHHYITSRTSGTQNNNNLKFFIDDGTTTNGTSHANPLTLTGSGRVGVGTQNPENLLHVNGDMRFTGSIWKNWGGGKLIMDYDKNYRQGLNFSTSNRTLTMFSTGASGDGGTLTFNTRSASGSNDDDIGVERMRIDQNGNVGIGTNDPEGVLHVCDSTAQSEYWNRFLVRPTTLWGDGLSSPAEDGEGGHRHMCIAPIMIQNPHITPSSVGQNAQIRFGRSGGVASGTWWETATRTDGKFQICKESVATTGIVIDTAGRVGIGNDSPWSESRMTISDGNKSTILFGPNSSWSSYLVVGAANSIFDSQGNRTDMAQVITTNGNLHLDAGHTRNMYFNHYKGSYIYAQGQGLSSDDRLKLNEKYITNATETLNKLKPQTYMKKYSLRDDEIREPRFESGLIAQDIYYDAPELRHLVLLQDDINPSPEKPFVDDDPTKDPDYSSFGEEHCHVDYNGFIAYLIKANQELNERVNKLSLEIDQIKSVVSN